MKVIFATIKVIVCVCLMEDQVLQYEVTDMLGKSHDSELGQSPISITCHEKQNRQARKHIFFPFIGIYL